MTLGENLPTTKITFEQVFKNAFATEKIEKRCEEVCSKLMKQIGVEVSNMYWSRKPHFSGLSVGSFVNIQLKRFGFLDRGTKNQVQIEQVPLNFQMTFDRGHTAKTMVLRSFVVHRGSSLSRGHYVAYARIGDTNEWKFFNDMAQSKEKPPTLTHDQVRNALKNAYTMIWEVEG